MVALSTMLLIGLGVGGCGFMSMTDLPEWLPGKWDLAYYSVSKGGRMMYLPNLDGFRIATSLTFTQGSPTFDHSGSPVPPGKGKVTVKDGVVHLEIPGPANITPFLPATIAKTPEGREAARHFADRFGFLPATIAKTPEGMVISLDVPAQGAEYKVYYTRAAE